MGWLYLTPRQADALRGNRQDSVIFDSVLGGWL